MSGIFNEKKSRSKRLLKPKESFEWYFIDIIPETTPKHFTSETTFSNYLLIVDVYLNTPKIYGMDIINTKDVMDSAQWKHSF